MTLINAENIEKYFGSKTVLKDINFKVDEGEAIGLVGSNGAGKTTLFRILTGEYIQDSGTVIKSKDLKIGYMEQNIVSNENISAYDSVAELFGQLFDIEKELENIANRINAGNHDSELLERQQFLTEKFQNDGGLTFKNKIKSTLTGLGIGEEQFSQPICKMSGGERSKLGLAKLLLAENDIMLLDEPTNHLDIKAIQWLEEFLISSRKAFMVISHDRYFLDKVTNKTYEIEHGTLKIYNAPYTQFLELKKTQREIEQKHYDDTKQRIEKMEVSIEKLRSFNREKSVKRAESKQKALEKLESTLEIPQEEEKAIHFSFKTSNPGPTEILKAGHLKMGFNENMLYSEAEINIRRGERVFLLGTNGCGKTTMLKQLLSAFKDPDNFMGQGKIKFGMGVKCGYYDQILSDLNLNKTVLDEVWDSRTDMTETSVRNALAAFLFKGDDVYKKVQSLSGGERARISLLKLMLSNCNLLFMDEPTNHLDIGSREALEQAISDFNGSMFIVSHDRYFINKLAHKVYYLDSDGTKEYIGGYDDFNDAMERIKSQSLNNRQTEKELSENAMDYKEKKRHESEIRKLKSAISKIETAVDENAEEIKDIELQLENPETVSDYQKITELTEILSQLKEKDSELQDQWMDLCRKLEETEQ